MTTAAMLFSAHASALASLRLVTLDLDDTLWPTGPVVRAANTAVANAAILCSRLAGVRIPGEGAEPARDCSRGEGQAAVA